MHLRSDRFSHSASALPFFCDRHTDSCHLEESAACPLPPRVEDACNETSTGPGVLGLVVVVRWRWWWWWRRVEVEVEAALAVVGYYPGPSQCLPEGV